MARKTFRGGIHPDEGKGMAMYSAIQEVLPEGELIYPLSQHIGSPAKPIVRVKETVKAGQMIAEAGGYMSVPIHSAVSGTVKKIEPKRTAAGDMVNSIIIESDGAFSSVAYDPAEDPLSLSREEILSRIQNAGVVGLGGAGFPTHVKLSPKNPQNIEYVIANCAECEPYLTADYRRMIETPEDLIEGMRIILQLFPNAKGVFAIEDNKPMAIDKIKDLVAYEPRMRVCELLTKYPQGGERQIIAAVTGRQINSFMLPADAGCIVDNVETIIAVKHAVSDGMPLIKRVATFSGDAIAEPANVLYSCGTPYAQIIDAIGGFAEGADGEEIAPEKMIAGGPMMGTAIFSLDVPMTKTASSLVCFRSDPVRAARPLSCISCGRCVEACPQRLVPSRLAKFSAHGKKEEFTKWHGMECIECGCCTFVCPSRIQVAQAVKDMKNDIRAEKKAGGGK